MQLGSWQANRGQWLREIVDLEEGEREDQLPLFRVVVIDKSAIDYEVRREDHVVIVYRGGGVSTKHAFTLVEEVES